MYQTASGKTPFRFLYFIASALTLLALSADLNPPESGESLFIRDRIFSKRPYHGYCSVFVSALFLPSCAYRIQNQLSVGSCKIVLSYSGSSFCCIYDSRTLLLRRQQLESGFRERHAASEVLHRSVGMVCALFLLHRLPFRFRRQASVHAF